MSCCPVLGNGSYVYLCTLERAPWSKSASELYRPSDRRLSAKLCQLLWIEGVAWSAQRITTAVFSVF
jgi:hypothetical protein